MVDGISEQADKEICKYTYKMTIFLYARVQKPLQDTYLFIRETSCQFLEYCLSETAVNSKYIHNSSTLEYICSLYHKESQYIAKLR
jgi:hypothetical protein